MINVDDCIDNLSPINLFSCKKSFIANIFSTMLTFILISFRIIKTYREKPKGEKGIKKEGNCGCVTYFNYKKWKLRAHSKAHSY